MTVELVRGRGVGLGGVLERGRPPDADVPAAPVGIERTARGEYRAARVARAAWMEAGVGIALEAVSSGWPCGCNRIQAANNASSYSEIDDAEEDEVDDVVVDEDCCPNPNGTEGSEGMADGEDGLEVEPRLSDR